MSPWESPSPPSPGMPSALSPPCIPGTHPSVPGGRSLRRCPSTCCRHRLSPSAAVRASRTKLEPSTSQAFSPSSRARCRPGRTQPGWARGTASPAHAMPAAARTHLPAAACGATGATPSYCSLGAASPRSSGRCPCCCTPGRPRGGCTGVQ